MNYKDQMLLKDKVKFANIDYMVAYGRAGSKGSIYNTNWENACPWDIIGVSVNGGGSTKLPLVPLDMLTEIGCTFVTDNDDNRDRTYNTGERALAEYLISKDYVYTDTPERGIWKRKPV